MVLSEIINKGEFVKTEAQSSDELFEHIYELLYDKGYVTKDFINAIKKREGEFPTGIKTASMSIALPHVDSEYVKENAIVICSCNPTIKFRQMDQIENTVDVRLAFILLINDPKMHVKTISELTKIWQDEKLLEQIAEAKSKKEIVDLIEGDKKFYE